MKTKWIVALCVGVPVAAIGSLAGIIYACLHNFKLGEFRPLISDPTTIQKDSSSHHRWPENDFLLLSNYQRDNPHKFGNKTDFEGIMLSDTEWKQLFNSITNQESISVFHAYTGKLKTPHYNSESEVVFFGGPQKSIDSITNEQLIETKYLDKDNNMSSFYERWGINKPWNANKVIVMSQTPAENTIDVYDIYKYHDTFAISQPIFSLK